MYIKTIENFLLQILRMIFTGIENEDVGVVISFSL